MKINIDNINNFFKSDDYEQDVKNFVIKLFNKFCHNIYDSEIALYRSCPGFTVPKFLFLDLGFYEIENDNFGSDFEGANIINFHLLNKFDSNFRKMLINTIESSYFKGSLTDFGSELLYDDTKVIFPFSEWKKVNRINKLEKISNIN